MTPPVFQPEAYMGSLPIEDHAPMIQAAIHDAERHGGGVVLLSGRNYVIRSEITLAQGGVTLAGVGWGAAHPFPGSWLHVTNPEITPLRIQGDLRRSAVIRDLAIRYDQPAPGPGWRPLDAPFAIDIDRVDDVLIHNVLLYNATRGIRGHHAGRLHLDRVSGQPLLVGLDLDRIFDVPRITNIHFWQFWTQDPIVDAFTKREATGIVAARCDNPHFANVFCLGYFRGMHFRASDQGWTAKFRISQIDCDFCRDGVFVDGPNTTGQITNLTTQGTNLAGSTGLFVQAPGAKVQIANMRVSDAQNNAIRVEGDAETLVAVANLWVDGWDQSRLGFPAVEAVPETQVFLSGARWFFRGGVGPETGGNVVFLG